MKWMRGFLILGAVCGTQFNTTDAFFKMFSKAFQGMKDSVGCRSSAGKEPGREIFKLAKQGRLSDKTVVRAHLKSGSSKHSRRGRR